MQCKGGGRGLECRPSALNDLLHCLTFRTGTVRAAWENKHHLHPAGRGTGCQALGPPGEICNVRMWSMQVGAAWRRSRSGPASVLKCDSQPACVCKQESELLGAAALQGFRRAGG